MDSVKDAVGMGDNGPKTQDKKDFKAGFPPVLWEDQPAEMSAAKLPLAYRDQCAHLLIPLNKCRYDNYYLPWRCSDERHGYEKCQYEEFKQRVKKMDEIRAEKDGARSN
ncbi:hypothetical protein D0868_09996 [Hortaea werneckii]|uniref:NADH dehydrogenase [ubiquinone] 1 beta subcomplex subunit 7 n=1 Tax=Hortaea werneckii TaxID=91943 RepID=A0A3M6Y6E2_HORWE|nr:hypothetical protein D0868_09996 [Hortaea werneckii]